MIKKLLIAGLLLVSLANADFVRDNENGIVADSETGLMWQDNRIGKGTWGNALSIKCNQSFGGYSDWRLPNYNELLSITDKSREAGSPTIKSAFKDVIYDESSSFNFYWTSTTHAIDSNHAWVIYFYNSRYNENPKRHTGYIRCVRGGG